MRGPAGQVFSKRISMYYSQDVIDSVLQGVDIVDVISPYVHLQKRGSNHVGLCPFHNEKTPSFSVSQNKQMFYCFGCGAGGNAATFLMKYENISFGEALRQLADKAGVTLPVRNYTAEQKKRQEKRERLLQINKETATYYYRLLRSRRGEKGMAYLKGRALSEEIMKRFGLGFAHGAASDLVKYLKGRGYSDEDILESGVAVFDEKRGLHDRFWNRVMFPIQDMRGRVIGFGGRVMGEGMPKYLNSPETPVFDKSRNLYGLHMARKTRQPYFILCEGYMDVIALHQAGFTEAVASLGTAFTEGQAVLIRRYVGEVILAYDSDGAGTRAALRNAQILRKAGIRGRVLSMKPYKDPDEFIRNLGADAFRERIREAENSFLFEIRMLEASYAMDDPAQRTEFHREIARRLCQFEEEVERENYLQALAARYFIREEALRKQVASYGRAGAGQQDLVSPDQPPARQERKPRKGNAASLRNQRLLMTWLSEDTSLFGQIRDYISPDDFEEGVCRTAAGRFWEAMDAGQAPASAVPSVIASFETEEDQQEAAALFGTRLQGLSGEQERAKAFHDIVMAVKRDSIDRLQARDVSDPMSLQLLLYEKKKQKKLEGAVFKPRRES